MKLIFFIILIVINFSCSEKREAVKINDKGEINWVLLRHFKGGIGISEQDFKRSLFGNASNGCLGEDCGYEDTLHKEFFAVEALPYYKDSINISWRYCFYNNHLVKIKLQSSNFKPDSLLIKKFFKSRGFVFLKLCKEPNTYYELLVDNKSLLFNKKVDHLSSGGVTKKYTIECDSINWSLANKTQKN